MVLNNFIMTSNVTCTMVIHVFYELRAMPSSVSAHMLCISCKA